MKNAVVGVTINELSSHIDDFYKGTLDKSDKFALMKSLDTDRNGIVSIFDLREVYRTYLM